MEKSEKPKGNKKNTKKASYDLIHPIAKPWKQTLANGFLFNKQILYTRT